MKLLALIIFSLLLAVGIGAYIEDDAGLITVVISGWTIQTSFSFFIISMLVLFLLSHFILRLISRLWRMPRELGRWQETDISDYQKNICHAV